MAEPAVRPVGAALSLLTGQTVCSSVSRSPDGLLWGSRWGENSDGAVRGCCIGACGWQERRVKKETSIASPSCSINSCDHTCLSQNHSPLIPNGPRVTWNPVGTSYYRSDSLNSQLRTKVAMPGSEALVLKSCCQIWTLAIITSYVTLAKLLISFLPQFTQMGILFIVFTSQRVTVMIE